MKGVGDVSYTFAPAEAGVDGSSFQSPSPFFIDKTWKLLNQRMVSGHRTARGDGEVA